MGWITIALLTFAVAAALFPFVRKDKGAAQFLAAALLLALAGYSWQGRPEQPGNPKSADGPRAIPDDDFAILHPDLLGRFDRAYSWMTLADGDRRRGNPLGGAQVLESAVRSNPRSYALWTAYAYALVASNDNLMSPASQLAFERAGALAPDHPGPVFFYGLALSRGGNWDGAEQVWREQLQGLGTGYPHYRAAIEERLAAIREARTTGMPVRPARPLPQRAPGQARRRVRHCRDRAATKPRRHRRPPATARTRPAQLAGSRPRGVRPARTAVPAPRPPPGGGSCRPRR